MDKWEYLIVVNHYGTLAGEVYYILPEGEKKKYCGKDTSLENVSRLLNHFGEKGWEVISSTDNAFGGVNTSHATWTMRRQKE